MKLISRLNVLLSASILATLGFGTSAWAANKTANSIGVSKRIGEIFYNPNEVINVYGCIGITTTIVFPKDEEIDEDASDGGFIDGWDFTFPSTRKNLMIIKPRKRVPFTNYMLTTRTSMDDVFTYYFEFDLASRNCSKVNNKKALPKNVLYEVRILHPVVTTPIATSVPTPPPQPPRNYGYSYCPPELEETAARIPAEVWDDGKFTYFRFAKHQQIPAFFVVGVDGESRVNSPLQKEGLIAVQRITRKIMLRWGTESLLVVRESPIDLLPPTTSETSIPETVSDNLKGEM